MKTLFSSIAALTAGCVMVGNANAAGPAPLAGRTITGAAVASNDANAVFEFDANLNLTWLRDWNFSSSKLNWNDAQTWAATLAVGNFGGWRLPSALNADGTGPCQGASCTGNESEFGNLWHTELANSGSLSNVGPFLRVQDYYWTSTEASSWAWSFHASNGQQDNGSNKSFLLDVVAVRDGDVLTSVPEPQTLAMMLAGLGVLVASRRRQQSRRRAG